MEGVVLVAGAVAVLVGLGALVEVARPWRRGPRRKPEEHLRKCTVCSDPAAMPSS